MKPFRFAILIAATALLAAVVSYLIAARTVQPHPVESVVITSTPASALDLRRSSPAAIQSVRDQVWKLVEPKRDLTTDSGAVERFRHLSEITGTLSDHEVDECCRFLSEVRSIDGIRDGMLDTIKNALINRLSAQINAIPQLSNALLVIQYDASQSDVMRDYAIQHLSDCFDSLPDPESVKAAFWARTDEGKATIGATALLALNRIGEDHKLTQIELRQLEAKAQALLASVTATEPSKMAGLEILRRNKSNQTLKWAKELLHSQLSYPLTVASIGAIGELGGAPEAALLADFKPGAPTRYASTLTTALQAIEGRLPILDK